jgi:D-sedoheptulose 7-phosphate isomerase
MLESVEDQLDKKLQDINNLLLNDKTFSMDKIITLAKDFISNFSAGKKVMIFGNGGSAAEAIHFAAEFTGKCIIDHKPLPVMCLNESQSALTAIANDYGVEDMFSRQVEAFAGDGDIVIGMSTSGKSKNVLRALNLASLKNCRSLLWTGNSVIENKGEIEIWSVPSNVTPRIQEVHLIWVHLVAETVEVLLEKTSKSRI